MSPSDPADGRPAGSFVLGRFLVRGELGRGGMGAVHRAWDPDLRRDVAIKRITADCSGTALARFEREAQVVARLRHPNICGVHETGRGPDGRPYVVMPLIEGRSLSDALDGGDLGARSGARLVAKVARAVDHAHDQRVLHRDLKPENVIVRDDTGEPLLIDFGVALLSGNEEERLTATRDRGLTGTIAYMAPEQISGGPYDERSDVYGLGATLYHVLAGRPPFSEEGSIANILARILRERPAPVRAHRSCVDDELERVCLRALEKAPSRRFESAGALADAIDAALRGERSRRAFPVRAALVAAALAVLLAGAAAVVLRPTPTARVSIVVDADDVEVRAGDRVLGTVGRGGPLVVPVPTGTRRLTFIRGGVELAVPIVLPPDEDEVEVRRELHVPVVVEATEGARVTIRTRSGTPAVAEDGTPIDRLAAPLRTRLPLGSYAVEVSAPLRRPVVLELAAHPARPHQARLSAELPAGLRIRARASLGAWIGAPPAVHDLDGDAIADLIVNVHDGGAWPLDAVCVAISGKDGHELWRFGGPANAEASPMVVDLPDGSVRVVIGVCAGKHRGPVIAWLDGRTGQATNAFGLGDRPGGPHAPWSACPLDADRSGRAGLAFVQDDRSPARITGLDTAGGRRLFELVPEEHLVGLSDLVGRRRDGAAPAGPWRGDRNVHKRLLPIDIDGDGACESFVVHHQLFLAAFGPDPDTPAAPDGARAMRKVWSTVLPLDIDLVPLRRRIELAVSRDGRGEVLFGWSYRRGPEGSSYATRVVIVESRAGDVRFAPALIPAFPHVEGFADVDRDGESDLIFAGGLPRGRSTLRVFRSARGERVDEAAIPGWARSWALLDTEGWPRRHVLIGTAPPLVDDAGASRPESAVADDPPLLVAIDPETGRVEGRHVLPATPTQLRTADLDGDGRAEIIVVAGETGDVIILEETPED